MTATWRDSLGPADQWLTNLKESTRRLIKGLWRVRADELPYWNRVHGSKQRKWRARLLRRQLKQHGSALVRKHFKTIGAE